MQDDSILPFFAKFIEAELGIIYAEHNYFQLKNRLEDITKLLAFENLDHLFEEAQDGITGSFKQLLLDVATNNETSFFRDPKIFRAMESVVLTPFAEAQIPIEPLRIWSAASSTGQEALSLAMMVKEWNLKAQKNIAFQIIASDISERVLQRARSGTYSQLEVQRGLSTSLLIKYFSKTPQDQWVANSELLQHTAFKKINLKESFAFSSKHHLVLCRNVLIYQSVQGKIEILNRISDTLAPGGFLVLGSGESLLGLSNDFEQVAVDEAVIYRKKA